MSRASYVLLKDTTLLDPIAQIGEKRKDKTLAKTVRELLRERIMQISTEGDPMVIGNDDDTPPRRGRRIPQRAAA